MISSPSSSSPPATASNNSTSTPGNAAASIMTDYVLPLRITSTVVRGQGRGTADLGIPTANLCPHAARLQIATTTAATCVASTPSASADSMNGPGIPVVTFDDLPCGIYWGFCRIGDRDNNNNSDSPLGRVYTAAISIGYNPTYGNEHKTIEPHLIAPAEDPRRHQSSSGETVLQDFYDLPIRLAVLGYLRPELPYEGLDKLAAAIKKDIAHAEKLAQGENETILTEKKWAESDQVIG